MRRLVSTLPLLTLTLLSLTLKAKNDIIIKINNHKYTIEEYENIYRKNNTQLNDQHEIKSPKEYVDLFINYKLKVIEAENRGMDTIKTFKDELNGYRKELAQPYLTDVTITEKMVQDAYYRTIHSINASHILFKLSENATPEDTLKIYNKAIEVRNKFLNKNETFSELARKYSEDPSVARNNGNLGYFKAFNMVTPFEEAAYNTPVGEISMPIRTKFGYHLINVHDITESKGKVKVAHIMKVFRNIKDIDPQVDKHNKEICDSLYNELLNGADFTEMVKKYSDDQSTISTNGEMKFIDETFRVSEFKDAAFSLNEIDEIHKPIRTPYGWHILKLIEKQENPTFDELKDNLTQKVKSDPDRSKHSKQAFLTKLKKEYGLIEHKENITQFENTIENAGDTIKEFDEELLSMPLYTINGKNFTVKDFYKHLKYKINNSKKTPTVLAKSELAKYEETVINQYEDSRLEEKYPEFASIVQEYHDGILLFAIMQEEVWDKAARDTIGLENYYANTANKYKWDKHFDGLLIECNSSEAAKYCQKLLSNGIASAEAINEKINEKPDFSLSIIENKWEKGDNATIDYLFFNGEKPQDINDDTILTNGTLIEAGKEKELDDARGLYISDYQKSLEKEWLESLKSKYKIKVNKRLLKKVKSI